MPPAAEAGPEPVEAVPTAEPAPKKLVMKPREEVEDDFMVGPIAPNLYSPTKVERDPMPKPGDDDFDLATYRWAVYDPDAGKQLDAGGAPEAHQVLVEENATVTNGTSNYGSVFGMNLQPSLHKPVWENKRTGEKLKRKKKQEWEVGTNAITYNNTDLENGDPWVVPKEMGCTVFGSGTTLDFRRARFLHPKVVVKSSQAFAGLTLYLPKGVKVVNSGRGLIGMHGWGSSETGFLEGEDGPTIELKGFSLFATATIRVDEECPPICVIKPAVDTLPPAGDDYLEVETAPEKSAAPVAAETEPAAAADAETPAEAAPAAELPPVRAPAEKHDDEDY
jgi:hypothetical protein